ncbi:MAG TPA: DUF2844 domain-containing protein [Steroidobacteraceae bacterium]|nr:DUF2844 domain-containing protein [Steroidobacteraceae bacterium]
MRFRLIVVTLALGLLGQAAAPLALAALGADVSSVTADGVRMKAQTRPGAAAAGYSVQELVLPSGTVVREYISPADRVFAVSWSGPTKPNLAQLFGTYFQSYQSGSKAQVHNSATRRHFAVRQSDLVVESNGRMRAFYGRAYVPSLLPANVSAGDIQ